MGTWRYLILKTKDDSLCWQLKYGNHFEIVGEIDEFYFLWAHGTCIAFPKYGKYDYEIEMIAPDNDLEGGDYSDARDKSERTRTKRARHS